MVASSQDTSYAQIIMNKATAFLLGVAMTLGLTAATTASAQGYPPPQRGYPGGYGPGTRQGYPPPQQGYPGGYGPGTRQGYPQQGYPQQGYAPAPGYGRPGGPPPPPPPRKPKEPDYDHFSVRFDPFAWVFDARPTLELEYAFLKNLSVELTPMQAVDPIITNDYKQSGGGLGLSMGLWLNGKACSGYVLRPVLQINDMHYESDYDGPLGENELTSYDHTEVNVGGMLGSFNTFGPVCLATGIGLLVDTKAERKDRRLRVSENDSWALDNGFGGLAPKVSLLFRLSLGIVF